jgi:hypothetical protein
MIRDPGGITYPPRIFLEEPGPCPRKLTLVSNPQRSSLQMHSVTRDQNPAIGREPNLETSILTPMGGYSRPSQTQQKLPPLHFSEYARPPVEPSQPQTPANYYRTPRNWGRYLWHGQTQYLLPHPWCDCVNR